MRGTGQLACPIVVNEWRATPFLLPLVCSTCRDRLDGDHSVWMVNVCQVPRTTGFRLQFGTMLPSTRERHPDRTPRRLRARPLVDPNACRIRPAPGGVDKLGTNYFE